MFGVEAERKAHPAIRAAREDLADVPGAIGAAKVDGQRLYKGPGSGGMGATRRTKSGNGSSVNRASVSSFKVRKRTAKG